MVHGGCGEISPSTKNNSKITLSAPYTSGDKWGESEAASISDMRVQLEAEKGEKQIDRSIQPLLLADLESSPWPHQKEGLERTLEGGPLRGPTPGSQPTHKHSQSSVHTCSSYCLEAISHKLARMCGAFKSTAIYPEQKGKVLSPEEAEGVEGSSSCHLKKPILS